MVGVFNTIVGLGVIYALMGLGLNEMAANALGYTVGLLVSYSLNRSWTFGDKSHFIISVFPYLALVAFAYLLNLAAVVVAHRLLNINAYAAQLIGIPIYTAVLFGGSHFFVFPGNSIDTAGKW